MSESVPVDYDAVLYDVFVENGMRLAGQYVALANQARTPEEKAQFLRLDLETRLEVDAVDAHDVEAVTAKLAEYRARLEDLGESP